VPAAFTLTKLGSERFVFLAAIVILVLLPARRLSAVRQPGLRPHAAGDDSVLVTTGPYAYVRHPMYVANMLIGIGIGLFAESAAVLVVIPAVLCLIYRLIIPLEEEQLVARFGPAYERYRAQAPRWIPTDLRPKARTRPQSLWTALHLDRRSTLTTAALAVVAQVSESWPHLLR
jgi:protein-S-isoprenylcysteine O-methyltransferase Ste14